MEFYIFKYIFKDLWHNRLQSKFKNERRRSDRDHPIVKKRVETGKRSTPKKQRIENKKGTPNFLPKLVEDIASMEKHIDFLKQQAPLIKKDNLRVADCLQRTLPYRRHMIVVDMITFKTFKERFPILMQPHYVSNRLRCMTMLLCIAFNMPHLFGFVKIWCFSIDFQSYELHCELDV